MRLFGRRDAQQSSVDAASSGSGNDLSLRIRMMLGARRSASRGTQPFFEAGELASADTNRSGAPVSEAFVQGERRRIVEKDGEPYGVISSLAGLLFGKVHKLLRDPSAPVVRMYHETTHDENTRSVMRPRHLFIFCFLLFIQRDAAAEGMLHMADIQRLGEDVVLEAYAGWTDIIPLADAVIVQLRNAGILQRYEFGKISQPCRYNAHTAS